MGRKDPAEYARLNDAQKALDNAKANYASRVKTAEKAVKSTQKVHDKAVDNAQKKLAAEKNHFAEEIADFDSIVLYCDHLNYQGYTLPLDPSVTVDLTEQAQENQAISSAENTEDGDNDETDEPSLLNLSIYGVGSRICLTITADRYKEAESFLQKVLDYSEAAPKTVAQHQRNLDILQCALQEAIDNTHDIDHAKEYLTSVKKDTSSIQIAQAHLQEVRNQTPHQLVKAYDSKKTRKKILTWLIFIVIIAVIIAALILWITGALR
ncbi:MAG: hypothetical protein J5965_03465 [Aeriscardovia sp.]|nr:hypothetical protein [Aeriscardovia sp.]MBO5633526.1 hypothetical protein [Aeriscardovia sp.]